MSVRKFHINFSGAKDHSIEYLIGILQDARTTTLQTIKNLTTAELDWQYEKGWNTIGALLAHIAAIEHYFRIEFIEGRKLTPEEDAKWIAALDLGEYLPQLINQQPIENYINELTESRELLLKELNNITFEDFTKKIEGFDDETGCNLAWALFHMVEDEIYHRGQISMVRKLYKTQFNK